MHFVMLLVYEMTLDQYGARVMNVVATSETSISEVSVVPRVLVPRGSIPRVKLSVHQL
jgi:hypothetical protein